MEWDDFTNYIVYNCNNNNNVAYSLRKYSMSKKY